VLEPDRRAHPLEPAHVQVDRTRPDLVAAGHRHPGAAASREQRPEHDDRRAHLPHELVGCFDVVHVVASSSATPSPSVTRTPKCSSISAINAAVPDARDVADNAVPGARSEAAMSLSAEFFAPETRPSRPGRARR